MTDKEKLHIYDQLREAHKLIRDIDWSGWSEDDSVAIEAVSYVLYLAEGHFSRMSE